MYTWYFCCVMLWCARMWRAVCAWLFACKSAHASGISLHISQCMCTRMLLLYLCIYQYTCILTYTCINVYTKGPAVSSQEHVTQAVKRVYVCMCVCMYVRMKVCMCMCVREKCKTRPSMLECREMGTRQVSIGKRFTKLGTSGLQCWTSSYGANGNAAEKEERGNRRLGMWGYSDLVPYSRVR